MINRITALFATTFVFCFLTVIVSGTNYYVSNSGNDSNDGTSVDFPWSSIEKVNSFNLQPGDSVFFKSGDVWRGNLKAKSGNSGAIIYYGSYGNGNKPIIMGSIDLSDEYFWQNSQINIWTTPAHDTQETELLSNNSFDTDASSWIFHIQDDASASGSRTTEEYYSAPACFHISCVSSGTNLWEIQFANQNLVIEEGKTYRLSFFAKSNYTFSLNSVLLMQSAAPYQIYFEGNSSTFTIDTEWNYYNLFFTSNISANDAMINYLFGGILPDNSEIYLDDISLKEVILNTPITTDIGNLIFNDASDFGIKKWYQEELEIQGDFWYDPENLQIYLFSETNPALFYDNIEAAVTKNLIDYEGVSNAVFENIEIKYGSAHGFGGGNTSNITIINCDISYIGGGAIYISGYGNIRYGNGIEFWENADNNLVEACRIHQIYDAAITNQNAGNIAIQNNIIYRNNLISNSEWSFEHWNRPIESVSSNIYFLNNTCLYAGDTWAKNQRDFDPTIRGSHLTFFQTEAQTSDFYIMNNIFYESESTILYCLRAEDLNLFNFGHNCWYQTHTDTLIKIYYDENTPPYTNIVYNTNQFDDYQNNYSTEENSILENPVFVNEIENDYNLNYSSSCIDAGLNGVPTLPVGETDFIGNNRIMPGYGMPPAVIDIGCFEFDFYSTKISASNSTDIQIRPNPTKDYIYISSNQIMENIIIYDIFGKTHYQDNTKHSNIVLNISNFNPGIYLISIKCSDYNVTNKIIKY
ncbi:MAG: T9SS type A sorting domain-containing protein [Bacteroidales bacterium]|nr:T9SS type A sorting domain-containing protein [Bacteroidales bacterium]